jgi:hypothetical protein
MSNIESKTDIQYTIRETSFGPLLIAIQDGKVCMINQSGDESDLLAALEDKFPSALYNHLNVGGVTLSVNDPTQQHIEAIVDLLDKPACNTTTTIAPNSQFTKTSIDPGL